MSIRLNLIAAIRRYGITRTVLMTGKMAGREVAARYCMMKHRNALQYRNPGTDDLASIERDFQDAAIPTGEFIVDVRDFGLFQTQMPFSPDYHGGVSSGVWNEKIMEHYIAYRLLGLSEYGRDDLYVDVAAACSPWARILRERLRMQAFAIDVNISASYRHLNYYRSEDATRTSFPDSSVRGISLQCAYEMFTGDADIDLIKEMHRILRPGGRAVIAPLYMHTHYCCYSSPECWGRGYADKDATEYIHRQSRSVSSSRKYNVQKLQERVLGAISQLGMGYRVHILRNREELSPEIYCHFILEITK